MIGTSWRVSTSATGRGCRLHRHPPGLGDLVRVAGPDHVEAGHRPQRGELLDRLVGRPVLAEPDRVVGEDVDHRQLHQRREPDRRAARSRRRRGRSTTTGAASRARGRWRWPRSRARGSRSAMLRPARDLGLEVVSRAVEAEADRGRVGQVGRAAEHPGDPGGDRVLDLVRGLAGREPLLVRRRSAGMSRSQPSGSSRRCIGSIWRSRGRPCSPRYRLSRRSHSSYAARARGRRCPRRSARELRRGPGTAASSGQP